MPDPRPAGPEPTIGDQLGLGPLFAPVPATFRMHKLSQSSGPAVHVVVFSTPTGTFGVVLSEDGLRALGRQATEQATGLVLPDVGIGPRANGSDA